MLLRIAALFCASVLYGQPSLHFEVASIRPTATALKDGSSFRLFDGGRIRLVNEPVMLLIRIAFKLQNVQIAGGPEWVETDRYDIDAKTGGPEKPKPDELTPMMRNLLEERFQLKFHKETRLISSYALSVAKGGPKVKLTGGEESSSTNTLPDGTSHLIATNTSMAMLASYIGNRLGAMVVDKTGLAGVYDFKLDWAPDERPDSTAPSLVTALRDQLGLRLESGKNPIEVLVIDKIERPSAN